MVSCYWLVDSLFMLRCTNRDVPVISAVRCWEIPYLGGLAQSQVSHHSLRRAEKSELGSVWLLTLEYVSSGVLENGVNNS
jgi:hypothetical protein